MGGKIARKKNDKDGLNEVNRSVHEQSATRTGKETLSEDRLLKQNLTGTSQATSTTHRLEQELHPEVSNPFQIIIFLRFIPIFPLFINLNFVHGYKLKTYNLQIVLGNGAILSEL